MGSMLERYQRYTPKPTNIIAKLKSLDRFIDDME